MIVYRNSNAICADSLIIIIIIIQDGGTTVLFLNNKDRLVWLRNNTGLR